ncbi:MAG: SDR family oxidoreductase [Planctomycetales bacterium]|nr:SDR family oxidoreductase [Planctomycetales bacterium]
MKNHILLTGATGFIGQYLLERLLEREIPVVVVARGNSERSANDRIMHVVSQIEERTNKTLPRPICFTGDLIEPELGLDDFAIEWFEENCRAVLHNAASIRFHCDGDRSKDPWRSNYSGTKNVLDLCKVAGIREFHHVSTAYVCGNRRDTCYEHELNVGQTFANDYQESKLEAEKAIRGSDFLDSKTFYRPALVVGDSRDGFTSAPDFGLYHYIEFNFQLTRQLRAATGDPGHLELPFRLAMTGNERRNVVTVDWIADAIIHLLTHPELHNETYNLTPQHPITSRTVVEGLAKYFNYSGIEFVGEENVDRSEQTDAERMFYDFASTFESYWDDEPIFDRTNTDRALGDVLPTPRLDDECMQRIIDYPVRECFAKKAQETTS